LLRAPLNEPAGGSVSGSTSSEPPKTSAPTAPRLAGPLELDLARIVLPHRVEDIPPPPEFIFRPLSSRRAARAVVFEPVTAPQRALPLLGYRVVDEHLAASRVERRWRVDVARCVAVADRLEPLSAPELPLSAPEPAALPAAAPEVVEPAELESLAHALFPDFPSLPGGAQLDLLASPVPGGSEPPTLSPSERAQPPESEVPSSKKRQRRRAARVASSASLATAALAANAELTRALSEIESAFSERRIEQPAAERKRRGRKAGKAPSKSAKKAAAETARRRAANAV
jgi:hypothetical protein